MTILESMSSAGLQKSYRAKVGHLFFFTAVLVVVSGCHEPSTPVQRQSSERIHEISDLDVMRHGRVRFEVFSLDGPSNVSGPAPTSVRYSLHSPISTVEDTDIRGFLDGTTKYSFNQGTAYHMRVGRRMSGALKREFELKRSLVRWRLPKLPAECRIVDASLSFWVEGFSKISPLNAPGAQLPLHLYVFPIDPDWGPGQGGISRDSFSEAAPGEASWVEARAGERRWAVPGALLSGAVRAIGVGLIEDDDKRLLIKSESLLNYLKSAFVQARSFDILLKLGDQEEDRYGTEIGLLTSQFGDNNDVYSKRPRLMFDIELRYPSVTWEKEFVLEPNLEHISPVLNHPSGEVLLTAKVESGKRRGQLSPAIWVRGGRDGEPQSDNWIALDMPLRRRWDWSQVKLSIARPVIPLGEPFSIELLEAWVDPGPREKQLPELLILGPSGRVQRIRGRPIDDLRYQIRFTPNELGLWRYGWSFLPSKKSPAGSHQGEGIFYVKAPSDKSEEEQLRIAAERLIKSFKGRRKLDHAETYQLNSFVRWASIYGRRGSTQEKLSEQLIHRVREARPNTRLEKAAAVLREALGKLGINRPLHDPVLP
jgi:hypothetical protein